VILLDTNLLARMTDSADKHYAASRGAIHKLLTQHEQIIIVPQNLYEFWAVANRRPGNAPAGQNGLGMSSEQASQWLAFFQRQFSLLPDREDLPARWHTLVRSRDIKGFKSHDARLVAAMESYGISRLLTFNASDFKDFTITVVSPEAL
jgi:predicted nucleic acid-binding protein